MVFNILIPVHLNLYMGVRLSGHRPRLMEVGLFGGALPISGSSQRPLVLLFLFLIITHIKSLPAEVVIVIRTFVSSLLFLLLIGVLPVSVNFIIIIIFIILFIRVVEVVGSHCELLPSRPILRLTTTI
jgi:hypothetical protein